MKREKVDYRKGQEQKQTGQYNSKDAEVWKQKEDKVEEKVPDKIGCTRLTPAKQHLAGANIAQPPPWHERAREWRGFGVGEV